MRERLRFRQVHLDFHTSPLIRPIGKSFDAKAFSETLERAAVNSVTCFAKCHHGMHYYPTKVGIMHPGLSFDLLGEMVEACHRRDIRIPAYITVCWDEWSAERHQEWRAVGPDGSLYGRAGREGDAWRRLCMNTAMTEQVAAVTVEVLRNYEVDGIFFDIVNQPAQGCFCESCRARMKKEGIGLYDGEALGALSRRIEEEFMQRMSRLVRKIRRDASIFFNGMVRVNGSHRGSMRRNLSFATHVEIESLPSGGWGYAHFPIHARYAQTLGTEFLGMTGKFHKSWADFGGFKRQAALDFECFHALALGGKCSIGDQLHPRGKLDKVSYELIGNTYRSVREKERWCANTRAVAQIAVLTASRNSALTSSDTNVSDAGAMQILSELKHQYQLIDDEADFGDYEVVVAPDAVLFEPGLARKIKAYLAKGGKVLASYESGLTTDGGAFAVREMGLKLVGRCPYTPSYFRVTREYSRKIGATDYVMYEPTMLVAGGRGARVAARIGYPYFNRTHETYCSHFHTPMEKLTRHPAAIVRGGVAYIASPIFRAYRVHGNLVYKTFVRNILAKLLPEPMVRVELPSGGIVTVRDGDGMRVVHILYYPCERRSEAIDLVEDVVELRDVRLRVRTGWTPRRAYLAPSREAVEVSKGEGWVDIEIKRVRGHAMVVLEK
ncbi:MAG: alpha-amylase family protein [Planctomycetota bacterium]